MQKSLRVESLQVNTTNNSKQPQWAAIVGASKGVGVQTAGEKNGSEWLLESSKMQMKPKSELQHKKNKTRGSGQRHEDVKSKEPKERLIASKGRVRKWPAKIAKKETAAKESWPTLGSTIPNQTVEKSIGPMWSKAIRDGDVKAVTAVKMVVKVERVTKEVTAPYVAPKKAWAKVVKATEPGKTTKKEEPQQQAPKKVVHGLLGEAWKEALDVGLRGEKLMPAAPKRCHSAVAAFHYEETNAARVDAADVKKTQRVSFLPGEFSFFKHLLSEKNNKTYLPNDFYKYREWTNQKEGTVFLPTDFYKYREWTLQKEKTAFYPKDFFKYSEWTNEKKYVTFFPCTFFKCKEWVTERRNPSFLTGEFFDIWKLQEEENVTVSGDYKRKLDLLPEKIEASLSCFELAPELSSTKTTREQKPGMSDRSVFVTVVDGMKKCFQAPVLYGFFALTLLMWPLI
ncbi:hypothetical_protein [Candidozyma auris]|uniref:hypothetical_protein n=1 Tax=Candidozyma auris TaxID=498019 RepID=UPI000D2CA58D|nr:hypothetical_protein [[Candida] auris]QEO22768.1 hypothetical_protein [[Candida] auris]GBL50821.1 hypothetical protein CAJCM15448_30950 [[Candida] auris]